MRNVRALIKRCGSLLMAFLLMLPVPGWGEDNAQVYYFNPFGGKYYHSTPTCSAVAEQYWPLQAFPAEELNSATYRLLLPCPACVLTKEWGAPGEGRVFSFFPTATPRPAAGPGEISEQEALRLFREAMTEEFGEERAAQLEIVVDYYPASEYYDAFYHLEAVIPISEEEQKNREREFERFLNGSGEYADVIFPAMTYDPTGFARNLDARTGEEYGKVPHTQ